MTHRLAQLELFDRASKPDVMGMMAQAQDNPGERSAGYEGVPGRIESTGSFAEQTSGARFETIMLAFVEEISVELRRVIQKLREE